MISKVPISPFTARSPPARFPLNFGGLGKYFNKKCRKSHVVSLGFPSKKNTKNTGSTLGFYLQKQKKIKGSTLGFYLQKSTCSENVKL